MTVTDERTYSTREVSMLTGLTKRQLDYWMRCRVLGSLGLEMPGQGFRIIWRESHLPVRRVANEWAEPVALIAEPICARWLLVDDEAMVIVSDDEALAPLLATMEPGVRVLDLDRVIRRRPAG